MVFYLFKKKTINQMFYIIYFYSYQPVAKHQNQNRPQTKQMLVPLMMTKNK